MDMMQRRFFSTQFSKTATAATNHQSQPQRRRQQWAVKQVTKFNFPEVLKEIETHIFNSNFVAVSMQKTGSYSAPWHKAQPFDTAETAYLKAKYAAERFQVLQFAVCPFSVRASKVIAYPYNFHLFPRDELKIGMPSYSFSCQSSYLTSMAREGFDFNACISDGISYLSKEQESAANIRIGNQVSTSNVMQSVSHHSVADGVFMSRIKSRVGNWIEACNVSKTGSEDALLSSLRKLISGNEEYGSRPSLGIDVCSELQVQLVLEIVNGLKGNLVPLIIPAKGGGTHSVRVVLASSKEDKDLFEKELQQKEEEQNRCMRGFREVIELISTSQKPVVAHNSLNDFSFIHSKFLAPLPPLMDEFRRSLSSNFPHVVDVNHLMTEIGLLKKMNSLPTAISQLERHSSTTIDMEIPQKAEADVGKSHGYNVLRLCELFAKLCAILKISPEMSNTENDHLPSALEQYTNILTPCSSSMSQESTEGDVTVWARSTRKVRCEDLVFLWGFSMGTSAGMLKSLLYDSHQVFSRVEDFDVRLVDKSCAAVVFWKTGLSEIFLKAMDSGGCDSLCNMVSEGVRAAGYVTYMRACKSGLWETDLADSLDKAVAEVDSISEAQATELAEIHWDDDLKINLDEL